MQRELRFQFVQRKLKKLFDERDSSRPGSKKEEKADENIFERIFSQADPQ